MSEARYPITMIGMANMLDKVIEQWESDLQHDDLEVKFYLNAKVGNMECKLIQSSHAKEHPQAKFFRTRLYLDKKTNFPVRVEQYGFPKQPGGTPPLIEEYSYLDVKTTVQLTDSDFDTENPKYDF